MISRQGFSNFFRHPFVILIATATISGLLVPYITQEWKKQNRKADVKATLITDAGKTVARILTASQFSEFGGKSRNQKEIDRAFQAWEIEHVVISSRIRAYLLDPTLASDWDRFGHMLRLSYASGADNPRRGEYLASLHEYLGSSNINWNALEVGYPNAVQFREYNRAWFQLKDALLGRYGEIARRILDAKSR